MNPRLHGDIGLNYPGDATSMELKPRLIVASLRKRDWPLQTLSDQIEGPARMVPLIARHVRELGGLPSRN